MNLEKLVAITGMSGIYRMVANRTNGLIIEELDSGKRKFVPARGHNFTPLESIGIYTQDGETTELKNVFTNMLAQVESNPPVSPEASNQELQAYFAQVLPEFDRDRVRISDIKKMIKWFGILHSNGMLLAEATPPAADEEE
ncbi:MAG: DUF5606 domain-containing protein [Saprospiraceae bacterium]